MAREIADGASVLDVGAGRSPFREVFARADYQTCDWENSIYETEVDFRAPADDIPVDAASRDAILCTQVLEHVPDPKAVLAEFHRILRPGALLIITVPLAWYLHEEPYDYFRYTSHGLRHLLESSGFQDIVIEPLTDSFTTLAQLVGDLGHLMGEVKDGFDDQRGLIGDTMRQLSSLIGSFANFDTKWIMPLGYAVSARRSA